MARTAHQSMQLFSQVLPTYLQSKETTDNNKKMNRVAFSALTRETLTTTALAANNYTRTIKTEYINFHGS